MRLYGIAVSILLGVNNSQTDLISENQAGILTRAKQKLLVSFVYNNVNRKLRLTPKLQEQTIEDIN